MTVSFEGMRFKRQTSVSGDKCQCLVFIERQVEDKRNATNVCIERFMNEYVTC